MKKTGIIAFVSVILALIFLLSSCGSYAVKISGSEVSEKEARYFLFNHYRDLCDDKKDSLSEEEKNEFLSQAKDETVADFKRIYAIQKLSKDNKVSLDDSDKEAVDAQYNSVKDSFSSDEEFEEYLAESWLFPELAKKILENQSLEAKLRNYITDEYSGLVVSDDKTLEEDIEKNFFRATQILIDKSRCSSNEEALEKAKKAKAALDGGAEFSVVMKEYSDDTVDENGYYFTYGQLIEEFEETALSLSENEVSDIVESPAGYHIVKRLTPEKEYIDTHFEDLRELYKTRCFNEILKKEVDSASVSVNESVLNRLYDEAKGLTF